MNEYIPDNADLYDQYEAEQERRHRAAVRRACLYGAYEREDKEDEFEN